MSSFTKTFVRGQNEEEEYSGIISGGDVIKEKEKEKEEGGEDCPICMDCIDPKVNCVTTECGHNFHAKCLFENIAHNGFDCPCCRGKMAEVEEEEEEEEFEEEEFDFEEEEEEEDNTDYLLRGMRWMFQRENDEELDDEEDDEDEETVSLEEDDDDDEEEAVPVPSAEYVANKLAERGVTFEDVLKSLLNDCHPEFAMTFDRNASKLYGKIRSVLANYSRDQPAVAPEEEEVNAMDSIVEIEVDYRAQAKV